jgi:plastocyanin
MGGRHRGPRALFLLTALPFLGACSGGTDPLETSAVPPHDIEILQDARAKGPNAFSPPMIEISLSEQDTVTWFNGDIGGVYNDGLGTEHNLESDDLTTFNSDLFPPGATFQATFDTPGVYSYHCKIHAAMSGVVIVNP